MFYDPRINYHWLPHDPFKSCVAPRPIGWISSIAKDGTVNLAPYSFFNAVADNPPMVMFVASGNDIYGLKHTLSNIESTGDFVCNIGTWALRHHLNKTSAPVSAEINEIDYAELTAISSNSVNAPRIAESPIHLECEYDQTLDLPFNGEGRNSVCFGRVVGIHISEDILSDGLIDMTKFMPIARLGYHQYTVVEKVFEMIRPTNKDI